MMQQKKPSNNEQTKPKNDLIIVSNRLPVTLTKSSSGEYQYKKSSGGLVTAISGMDREFKWIGWIGLEVNDVNERKKIQDDLSKLKPQCHSVFITQKMSELFYEGFSNSVLWPLFHYLFEKTAPHYCDLNEQWNAYKQVNKAFADAILEIYKEGDMIWVHDYHLMLLPQMLRKQNANINVGFFLHIPFPTSEIYRTLPVRSELLEGLLSANLVGFHTYDFTRHFLSSCSRTLGCSTTPQGIYYKGMFVRTRVFPIGINPQQFTDGTRSEETQKLYKHFKEVQYPGKKILLGIDRLDYTKGLDLKLLAFERFLQKNPEFKEKVVLIQVGVPSREKIEEYKQLGSTVNGLVGKINATFGTLKSTPVHYINQSVNFPELCALYSIADVCIVSSVRDGMNLVSLEYVACQNEARKLYSGEHGVLMLSEFAGSAKSLGGSVIINPWNINKVADQTKLALTMSSKEKTLRHNQNWQIVSLNTSTEWGNSFMKAFEQVVERPELRSTRLPHCSLEFIKKKYVASKKRLFCLDYDGTLVNLTKNPELAIPSQNLIKILTKLATNPRNYVYIISGRTTTSMNSFLGSIQSLGLTAEHGMYCRHPNSNQWSTLFYREEVNISWMKEVKHFLEDIVLRTPGSFYEQKETSLVFNYRACDPEYGTWVANELKLHLEQTFSNLPLDVIHGRRIVEILPITVSKGTAAKKLVDLFIRDCDFIFSSGDDMTDEEMFKAILKKNKDSFCCAMSHQKGADRATVANCMLDSPSELVKVLQQLSEIEEQ